MYKLKSILKIHQQENRLILLRFLVGVALGLQLIIMIAFSVARPVIPPDNVRVGNVTDVGLSISWTTDKPSTSSLIISSEPNKILRLFGFFLCDFFSYRCNFINDEMPIPSTTHFINLKDLTPETFYYYRIVSSNRLFKTDANNNILPSVFTGPTLGIPTSPNPVYSFILRGDGKTPVVNSLITISLTGSNENEIKSSLLTTKTDKKGLFIVDLGNLRTPDLKYPIQTTENDRLSITVLGSNGLKTRSFVNYSPKKLVPIIVRKTNYSL